MNPKLQGIALIKGEIKLKFGAFNKIVITKHRGSQVWRLTS
ncbi:hypothetical protein HanIR_Chr03g0105001 [Helianthus annuus]|nr:hypothetical protein HanIR_Chr03g0105001 [Helianthus annuus]